MVKKKKDVRDRWSLLQTKFKRTQQEKLRASGIDCKLSENDALMKELCEKEDSFSAKEKKSQTIKRQLKKSERRPWSAWPRERNQVNQLEAALK